MATGGAGQCTAPLPPDHRDRGRRGDGIPRKKKSGGMEFYQLIPLLCTTRGKALPSWYAEAVRGFGAWLKTIDWKRVHAKYVNEVSGTTDIVARAIDNEMKTRGG